jgi:hypothetical protein
MAIDKNWEDLPPQGQKELLEKDRQLLKEVRLRSFEARPNSLEPFGEAELSWNVSGPGGPPLAIKLGDSPVGLQDTRTVGPLRSTSYSLVAQGFILTKSLGQVLLTVDTEECRTGPIAASLITGRLEDAARQQFSRGRLSIRNGTSPKAIMDAQGISIHVPARIDVPNWFNADLDVDLAFSLFVRHRDDNSRVAARLTDVGVDVSFALHEHVLSLGCSAAVSSALEKLMESTMRDIMAPTLQAQVGAGLREAADGFLAFWTAEDENERPFRLYDLETDPSELRFIGCPIGDRALTVRPGAPHFEVEAPNVVRG